MGHVIEPLEIKTIDFGPLPEKDWALQGHGKHKDGKYRELGPSYHPLYDGTYLNYLNALREKYKAMESELRYEEYKTQGAKVILVAYGYCSRVAKEAVDMAQDEKPDLILMDILMPKMDGFELCKRLNEQATVTGSRIPILILSAVREDSSRRRYELETKMDLGVNGYVEKPISPHILLQRVEQVLTKSKTRF
jgi:CheY-like chemotaxis protein